jgi:hypothetical protein
MTPEDKRGLEDTIHKVLKSEKHNWLTITERLILPISLGIATIFLGINSSKREDVQVNLARIKQTQDSIKSTKDFQLELVSLYLENITSTSPAKIMNTESLLSLMDSDFVKKIITLPGFVKTGKPGDTVYNNEITNIQKEILLSYSNVKVYYNDAVLSKAKSIDTLLRLNGATSNVSKPDYPLSFDNQIVYYNVKHRNFCEAVKNLLRKNNFGEFIIRQSSGNAPSNDYFKIYVVK